MKELIVIGDESRHLSNEGSLAFQPPPLTRDKRTINLKDIIPWEEVIDDVPPPATSTSVRQTLLTVLSLSLPILSGYFLATNIQANAQKDQSSEGEIQIMMLLALAFGASIQNLQYIFPTAGLTQIIRRYQYRFLSSEWPLATSLQNLLNTKYYLIETYFPFRYGAVLVDLGYKIKNRFTRKNKNLSPILLSNNVTPVRSIKSPAEVFTWKQYCSLPWALLGVISLLGIVTIHTFPRFQNEINDKPWEANIINYSSALGYLGLGFFLGNLLEKKTAHINSHANNIQRVIYYLFGTLITPGTSPYHFIMLALGGIVQGWNSSFSQRIMKEDEQLLNAQINSIRDMMTTSPNASHFIDNLEPYADAHRSYLESQKKFLRRIKYVLLPMPVVMTVLGSLWTPLPFHFAFMSPLVSVFIPMYFYSVKKVADRQAFYFNFLFQKNPLLIVGMLLLVSKTVYKIRALLNQNFSQIADSGFIFNIVLGSVLGSLIAATYYVRWLEQIEIDQPINENRFAHLEKTLREPNANDATVELTPREACFFTKQAKEVTLFKKPKNSAPMDQKIKQDDLSADHQKPYNVRMVNEQVNEHSPDLLVEQAFKSGLFLAPTLSKFPIQIAPGDAGKILDI